MEYYLYADINDIISNISEKILYILKKDSIFGDVGGIKVNTNKMSCYCDVFTLFIDNSSDSTRYVAEEAKQSLNVGFYMYLHTQCENVVVKTIYFVGKVMEEFSGNIVLMQNGDTPIVRRIGGKVIVDKSKVVGFYPFEMLETEYEDGKLDF